MADSPSLRQKGGTLDEWQVLLRQYKEKLAQRLWALSALSETEKEIAFREYLTDLDRFEKALASFQQRAITEQRSSADENDLLRSLLGVPGDDVKARVLSLNNDLNAARRELEVLQDELRASREKAASLEEANEAFRTRVQELEKKADQTRVGQLKEREDDIRFFSDTHDRLKNQLKDLESRFSNLRHLFKETNDSLLKEKQEEITLLQKKLLDEMEAALRQRQQLAWAEEELFAKGVVQRIRNALVSVQGQLFLSLERLGLLDPETKSEAFWKARIRLLMEGAGELSANFHAVQSHLQDVGKALDDFLSLTHHREVVKQTVSLKSVVQEEMAEAYVERRPALSIEFLAEDPFPPIQGDPTLLRFIVKCLLQNALEALPHQAGQIIISLKNHRDKGEVELLVRDSGSGIPAHLTPKLFQPFFTTKQHRQGLSLSRAKRYSELHGGTLVLVQTGMDGTTFQLVLPQQGRADASSLIPSLSSLGDKRKGRSLPSMGLGPGPAGGVS